MQVQQHAVHRSSVSPLARARGPVASSCRRKRPMTQAARVVASALTVCSCWALTSCQDGGAGVTSPEQERILAVGPDQPGEKSSDGTVRPPLFLPPDIPTRVPPDRPSPTRPEEPPKQPPSPPPTPPAPPPQQPPAPPPQPPAPPPQPPAPPPQP